MSDTSAPPTTYQHITELENALENARVRYLISRNWHPRVRGGWEKIMLGRKHVGTIIQAIAMERRWSE